MPDQVTAPAPALDAGHQHRLATVDPALLSRLKALQPAVAAGAAVEITRAVA
ncbi:MAG TPA: hypothetical protein VLZ05_15340 [Mycobacterium sp.]|nr:hypothetical protein [Mycobacterium sp.]HUH70105.1 hypothetical protein [Mycobacterium sp.]